MIEKKSLSECDFFSQNISVHTPLKHAADIGKVKLFTKAEFWYPKRVKYTKASLPHSLKHHCPVGCPIFDTTYYPNDALLPILPHVSKFK